MKFEQIIRTALIWLPSLILCTFFIPNAIAKIMNSNQQGKIITNSTVLMIVGIILLIATVLFLINKTILIGTAILASYMTCIVFIHIYKEKPFEVVMLIVVATIFAAYLRKPELFYLN